MRGYKIGGRSWVSLGTPPSPLLKGGGGGSGGLVTNIRARASRRVVSTYIYGACYHAVETIIKHLRRFCVIYLLRIHASSHGNGFIIKETNKKQTKTEQSNINTHLRE